MAHKIGVPIPPTPLTLEEIKEVACCAFKDFLEECRIDISAGASPAEMSTWANKAARAHRFVDGVASEADTVALTVEAVTRGRSETLADLAALQIYLEDQYSRACSLLDGARRATCDAINAAESEAAIMAIVASAEQSVLTKLSGGGG